MVARRDSLGENIEVEIDINDEDNKELSVKQIALIDHSVLRAFVMCEIPFRVIKNPYFISMLKNIWSNYNPSSWKRLFTNLLYEKTTQVEIKISNSLERAKNLILGMKSYF